MPITRKALAALDWSVAFQEGDFRVLLARKLDEFAIIHDKPSPNSRRVRIRYSAYGRKFDSPSEAVKHYNAEELKRAQEAVRERSRLDAAAGAEPAAPRKGALPRRRD